jgi:predicted ATPase
MAKVTRHSRDELRELILETGRTMLEEEGLSSGAAALTFKRVFARIEEDTGVRLTNASVIRRVWDSQSDFQTDVLATVALGQSGPEIDAAEMALAPIVASIDLATLEARERALRDLCRLAGELNTGRV